MASLLASLCEPLGALWHVSTAPPAAGLLPGGPLLDLLLISRRDGQSPPCSHTLVGRRALGSRQSLAGGRCQDLSHSQTQGLGSGLGGAALARSGVPGSPAHTQRRDTGPRTESRQLRRGRPSGSLTDHSLARLSRVRMAPCWAYCPHPSMSRQHPPAGVGVSAAPVLLPGLLVTEQAPRSVLPPPAAGTAEPPLPGLSEDLLQRLPAVRAHLSVASAGARPAAASLPCASVLLSAAGS